MKIKLALLVCVVGLLFSGCVSVNGPLVATLANKTFPSSGGYEVLGEVYSTGTYINVLGIISFGGNEYANLLDIAQKKYPLMNDVVSVTVDDNILSFLGIFTSVDRVMRGIAIRYVKE